MDQLATLEHLEYGPPKVRQRKIVAQIYGAQQLPERVACAIDAIPASGRAEALKDIGRAAPALLDGGEEAKQVGSTLANRLEGYVVLHYIGDGCRHFEASRQV